MDNAQLKEALQTAKPVIMTTMEGDVQCKSVDALIWRRKHGRIVTQAEVMDANENCVYISKPENLRFADERCATEATN